MLRQLIVNADDYGTTPGVSRGILRAHSEGIVTSTSVMINMPAAAEWTRRAVEEAPDLGLGLHFTLTAGPPVSDQADVGSLVGSDGSFLPRQTIAMNAHRLDRAQVEREMRAQIEAFTRIAGRAPDHLDSHHHITYVSPPLAQLTITLAAELGVPIRNPLPTHEDIPALAAWIDRQVGYAPGEAYVAELANILGAMTSSAGVRTPDAFVAAFYGDRATLGDLLLVLLDLPEGISELMCHPGEVDDELRAKSGYLDQRETELAALTAPSTREVLNTEFIQLLNFGDLQG